MKALDRAFDLAAAAAVAGERCPFNDQIPGGSTSLTTLARQGRLRIEVFRHNWRVVTIMEGRHKGLHTQQDPTLRAGSRPYKVVDSGSLENRQQPWKPGDPRPG